MPLNYTLEFVKVVTHIDTVSSDAEEQVWPCLYLDSGLSQHRLQRVARSTAAEYEITWHLQFCNEARLRLPLMSSSSYPPSSFLLTSCEINSCELPITISMNKGVVLQEEHFLRMKVCHGFDLKCVVLRLSASASTARQSPASWDHYVITPTLALHLGRAQYHCIPGFICGRSLITFFF